MSTTCPLPDTENTPSSPTQILNFQDPETDEIFFTRQNKPAESTGRVTFKSGQKRTLKKIKNVIKSQKYRPDLQQAALRRASAIYRSQKTKPAKKTKAAKKTEA